jgi:hypothetical protein
MPDKQEKRTETQMTTEWQLDKVKMNLETAIVCLPVFGTV